MNRMLRQRIKSRRSTSRLRRRMIRRLRSMFPGRVIPGHYDGCIRCPEVSLDVVVAVCRHTAMRSRPTWSVSPRLEQKRAVTFLCLLNNSNDRFAAFYVFPRLQVRHGFRIYANSNVLRLGKKIHSLVDFYRAVIDAHRQLSGSKQNGDEDVLIGGPQIAMYLGQSPGIVRRLIRQGMPVTQQGRCMRAVSEQLKEWVRENGTVWEPCRDRLGRYARPMRGDGHRQVS